MNESKKNKVSVIVPCYNYAQFLGEALDSLLAQTYANWECIVVNDGSPDNTEDIALAYCNRDSRIKYFYKENGGHSAARNFGINQSEGTYILLLDADDWISNEYLEKATEIMDSDEHIKLATGQVQLFGNNNEKILMPPFDLRSFLVVNYITISSLFRRSDYYNTKGFDETMLGFEDWDFFISLLKNGGKVLELPFTCLYYRKKEESLYVGFLRDKKKVFRDLFKLYCNHIDSYEKYFVSPIELIQENEKVNRVIDAYLESRTYKWGSQIKKIKEHLLRKIGR